MRPFKQALVEDGIPFTSFAVADVDAEYERLVARVCCSRSHRPRWARHDAVLDDTCGNLIQIASQ
jgi:hypothetical protein